MRLMRLGPFVVIGLFFSISVIQAQQSSSPATPTRDPQALSTLAQCVAAVGGTLGTSGIQDFTETGNVTYFWGGQQVQGSVTVRGLGVSDFRFDANLPDGVRSWAVIRGKGSGKTGSEKPSTIPYQDAVNLTGLTFPFLGIVSALQQASSAKVTNLGSVQVDGHSAYRVRVQQAFSQKEDPSGVLAKWNTKDFFIDSSTFQLVKTEDVVYSESNHLVGLPRQIHFGEYKSVNGVLIPFSVTETVNGQQAWTIELSQVAFNTGLQDSDFQL